MPSHDSTPSTAVKLLGWLNRWPRLAQAAKRAVVEHLVPFNRALGIRVAKVAPDSGEVILRLPMKRRNLNVSGTIHGGAILALAETVHGVAVLWQFPPAAHRMFTKRADIQYLAPGRGEIRACFRLEPKIREEIGKALEMQGQAEVTLSSLVTDQENQNIARLTAVYVIRRVEEAGR
jgi:uncharacterized protein (TIGR00369 family)